MTHRKRVAGTFDVEAKGSSFVCLAAAAAQWGRCPWIDSWSDWVSVCCDDVWWVSQCAGMVLRVSVCPGRELVTNWALDTGRAGDSWPDPGPVTGQCSVVSIQGPVTYSSRPRACTLAHTGPPPWPAWTLLCFLEQRPAAGWCDRGLVTGGWRVTRRLASLRPSPHVASRAQPPGIRNNCTIKTLW